MYYVPLIALIVLVVIEYKYNWKYAYNIGLVMLTLMVCLRFGQGTDYFAYLRAYYVEDVHSEIGYRLICKLFQLGKIRYEILSGFIGFVTMYCLDKAIRKYSPSRTLSLLLVYPTIFLTYFFSATRQGFVIAFFLGFMLTWLEEEKWCRYLLASLVLMTIHIAALMFLPILFIKKMPLKSIYWLVGIAMVCGITFALLPNEFFLITSLRKLRLSHYLSGRNVSILGLAERCCMLVLIGFLYRHNLYGANNKSQSIQLVYKIYLYGFSVTILFMPWSLMSSRIPAAMKAVEILLIPIMLNNSKRLQKLITTMLILYVIVMTTKNLYSYIQQSAPYYNGYNPLTYPYISVLNKDKYKDIWYNNEIYQNYIYYRDCAHKLTF